eukprot:1148444-Pelagomonas_calceolata.AAC.3
MTAKLIIFKDFVVTITKPSEGLRRLRMGSLNPPGGSVYGVQDFITFWAATPLRVGGDVIVGICGILKVKHRRGCGNETGIIH